MAFATDDDIAARLGVTLTTAQQAQATAVLNLIALEIEHATGKAEADIDATLPILKVVSVQACIRAIANPTGAQSTTEQLGQYNRSDVYARSGSTEASVLLTNSERSKVRNAVLGGPLVSPRTPPIDDSFWPVEIDDALLS